MNASTGDNVARRGSAASGSTPLLPGTGLRGVDAGKLSNSRLLERLCAFGIEPANRYRTDGFGFKFPPAGELPQPS